MRETWTRICVYIHTLVTINRERLTLRPGRTCIASSVRVLYVSLNLVRLTSAALSVTRTSGRMTGASEDEEDAANSFRELY
ncbi:hypothetical protein E2C01_049035 [Portunus trituberculatus]|uniref:Uncharacterized protein n=1 Tax=Portunus trituberculatus TaxID=210409 RepID=A0A5B7G559_PORTR|nr:hypothetical protein [Portunus trituberculatus]